MLFSPSGITNWSKMQLFGKNYEYLEQGCRYRCSCGFLKIDRLGCGCQDILWYLWILL